MKTNRRFHHLALGLALASLSPFCLGAESREKASAEVAVPTPSGTNAMRTVPRISIDQAPLSDAIRLVCKEFGADYALAPELSRIQVEKLDLTSADLATILDALKVACGNQFQFRLDFSMTSCRM